MTAKKASQEGKQALARQLMLALRRSSAAGVLHSQAIARKVEGLYGTRYDPEHEITVTAGGTEALFSAIAALVRPGDEVVLFEPAYDSYAPSVALNGGTAVRARLRF